MTPTARTRRLALALLLPVAHLALTVFFIFASLQSATQDRAVIWAEGSPAQLAALGAKVQGNGQFPARGTMPQGLASQRPAQCRDGARAFSLGGLRAEESHAARQLLEGLADEAGVRVCLSDYFILNEVPGEASGNAPGALHLLLQSQLIPAGLVGVLFFALAPHAGFAPRPATLSTRALQVGAGLLVGIGACALGAAFDLVSGGPVEGRSGLSIAALGVGMGFALLVVEPALSELVHRHWLITVSEPALGTAGAAMFSVLVYVALQLPTGLADVGRPLIEGTLLALLYLRTRSLAACITAHAVIAACAFLMAP
ncbi:type II CAAX prenyl endopeptidase Rce1 family protein [Arenimonas sp. MALMAid1274]|uniref:CPBP family intramembrane glutamic endopeptidase n=1 Tax=Arenimonas sp. MALMAid1274 TaxID=3411630 RepID=UPI003BA145DB